MKFYILQYGKGEKEAGGNLLIGALTTHDGKRRLMAPEGQFMAENDNSWRSIKISIRLIEIDGIFYLEAHGDDTLIRTKRRKRYKSVQRLSEFSKKLPAPAFVCCHREYIVNLKRVRSITPRNSRDYDFRLDPPVNHRIPIARDRLKKISKILGV